MPNTPEIILLADESPFFLNMERQFLRNVPATVVEAHSTEEVLQVCRQTLPQLIFLADTLTDGEGCACCRQLKADPAFAKIPIVFVGENAAAQGKPHDCSDGCDMVLSKPLDRYRFLEAGRKFLAGIRERRRSCLISVSLSGNGTALTTRGLDISSGGVFVDTGEQLIIGTELQLDLHLARPHETGPRFRCRGLVAWRNTREKPVKPHHPVGFGIKFVDIDATTVKVLERYLKDLDQQKAPAA